MAFRACASSPLARSRSHLADQLRTLSVRNYRQMGLYSGNPLRAHRLTRDGSIEPIVGDASNVNGSLMYYMPPKCRTGTPGTTTSGHWHEQRPPDDPTGVPAERNPRIELAAPNPSASPAG